MHSYSPSLPKAAYAGALLSLCCEVTFLFSQKLCGATQYCVAPQISRQDSVLMHNSILLSQKTNEIMHISIACLLVS